MEPLINSLNEQQKEAAVCIDEHLRIIAGAGSGKTRVLMARIEYLINEIGVYPSRILAITFTNKAASEMKERLEAQLGEEARHVRISTIHSFALRILREDAALAGYPKNFTVLDSDDQKSILRKIYTKHGWNQKIYSFNEMLSKISSWKRRQVSPAMLMERVESGFADKVYLDCYKDYEQALADMLSMDFDDLLLECERLLRLEKSVRDKWQGRLDYLHVDEFQDVDPIQYEMIRHLVREDARLAVVGDPDQTIYTWRGASVDIILNFEKDFQPSKTVLLTKNYRSSENILNASNALISQNRNRVKKDLTSDSGKGEVVYLFSAADEESEAKMTVRLIEELHEKEQVPYPEIAILYRSNYISRSYEKELRIAGIPYQIYGGIRFYQRAEVKDILSYLQLLSGPSDEDPRQMSFNIAIDRIGNVPRRQMGPKFFEAVDLESVSRGVNYLEVMRDSQTLSSANKKKAQAFAALIDELREDLEKEGLEKIVDIIVEKTGYDQMPQENKEERMENLEELQNDIIQMKKDNPGLTLEDYLQEAALFSTASLEDERQALSLMTVHAAKGTEFDTVFVGQVNENVFPSSRALESGNRGIEEERRLMYVAMTRAKKRLFISWNSGYSYRSGTVRTRSRFVREIPDELTNLQARKKKKESAQPTLKKPKSRLSTDIRPGSRVRHKLFGEGTVIEANSQIIQVVFDATRTTKKIARNYLELIS